METGYLGKIFFQSIYYIRNIVNGFLDNNLNKQVDLEYITIYAPQY